MNDTARTDDKGFDWFQASRKGVDAGDVFAVPLPDGSFGFGRVLNVHEGATLAEFFRARRATPDFDPAILDAGRLFSPVGFSVTEIEWRSRKRPWKVIHKQPGFYPDDLYEIPFATSSDGQNWEYFTLANIRQVLGPVPAGDVDNWQVAHQLPQHPGRIRNVIAEQLEKQGL